MKIVRQERTLIPNTLEGRKFAKEYAKRLKEQWAFRGCAEDTINITIDAEYIFELKEEDDGENTDRTRP